jgi:ATP-dependent Clp protease ATP-binding subunit ClpC
MAAVENNNVDFTEDMFDTVLDITSVVKLVKFKEENCYIFERLLDQIDDKLYGYAVEITYLDCLITNFPVFFDVEDIEYVSESKELSETSESNRNLIINYDYDEISNIYNQFTIKLFGHNRFKKDFLIELEKFVVFNDIGEHPILSIFLLGSSGIGKTHVARIFNGLLGDEQLIKINFGNYGSQGALNSLIGSPRGYIGSESGELNDKVKKNRNGVILIDEFEKADPKVINFFLELLEEGEYTDLQGEKYDLNGYVIFFTSNLDSQSFKSIIPPEFRSRLDYVSRFDPLTLSEKKLYFDYRIQGLIKKYQEKHKVTLDDAIVKKLKDINLTKYHNIRDLNREINTCFAEWIWSRK